MDNYRKNNNFELIEILENIAVIYQRGLERKEVFDKIHINGDGIYTVYILKKGIRVLMKNLLNVDIYQIITLKELKAA